jgi:SAM-dependent methyltransferase
MKKIQVKHNHYFSEKYNDLKRFISYWQQIDLILKTKPKTLLEVGIGNGLISDYLKKKGVNVKTFDHNPELKPDFVGDLREDLPFKENQFDTVACFEVLEHLPLSYLEGILSNLCVISKNYVVLSVPHTSIRFAFGFKFPFVQRKDFLISIPIPLNHKFGGEHYWELGKNPLSLREFRNKIKEFFYIKSEIRNPLNPTHRFFLLKKGLKNNFSSGKTVNEKINKISF